MLESCLTWSFTVTTLCICVYTCPVSWKHCFSASIHLFSALKSFHSPGVRIHLSFWDKVSHRTWSLSFHIDWLVSKSPDSPVSASLHYGYGHMPLHRFLFLYGCCRSELRSSSLLKQEAFSQLSHFSSPMLEHFKVQMNEADIICDHISHKHDLLSNRWAAVRAKANL